ncbi:uncharacterized protein LOC112342911 [Selaginella moellendorffii]|uniref:uncharacterized protein LOC112342911 n=1 Tax=Selaginella moellendorffii TaxID=88036 RepID=UPI000D1D01F0|nr:uncharacterized protein LOC112342911 [Selaginella moellendorffii]|eukprot:XP_024521296.1 uncharacterized protein LOC112342911 [Selaginella moellendorffii]
MVQAYAENGELLQAENMFSQLSDRNIVATNAMITAYAQRGQVSQAKKLFEEMPERDISSYNVMILAYSQQGLMEESRLVFDSMPCRNLVSSTTMVQAYAQKGYIEEAERIFNRMVERDDVSWTTMLQAYASNGNIERAQETFRDMPRQDLVAWTAMVCLYAQNRHTKAAKFVFDRMPERNAVSWILMITALGRDGKVEQARKMLDTMPHCTVACYNAMIGCYGQNGHVEDASEIFRLMIVEGAVPDEATFTSVLGACSHGGLLEDSLHHFRAMPDQHGVEHAWSYRLDILRWSLHHTLGWHYLRSRGSGECFGDESLRKSGEALALRDAGERFEEILKGMDAAALYAGTVLLRKTFEALAQRSVTSLFTRLHSRFSGQHRIELLQKELESRLQVLSLPVDMCVQYVLHGNTVLQGALDMILRVINDIVRFQEELESQVYNEDVVKTSPSEAENRLQGFLTRLDAILPYMAMAMNAVSLLKSEEDGISPARLMDASYLIRGAEIGNAVLSFRVKLYEYETRLTLPRWQEKIPHCTLTLRKLVPLPDAEAEFLVEIDNSDEDHNENNHQHISIPLSNVAAIGSSTLHVLGLGQHELEAVLLIDVYATSDNSPEPLESPAGDRPQVTRIVHYALQCMDGDDGGDNDSASSSTQSSEALGLEDHVGARTAKLGVLEYVLRLCILQIREEKDHWLVPDERIRMFFADPRFNSEPVRNTSKPHRPPGSGNLTPRNSTPLSGTKSLIRTPTTRGSRRTVTDMFYELNLDHPAPQ